MNCIFCKIAKKEIPAKVVYEDDVCFAFLDLSQVTDGHTLVIPKEHASNYLEVDDEVLAHMSIVTKKLAGIIKEAFHASGVNILSNAGEVAGQTVMHFHMHIIPRYDTSDGIEINFKQREDELDLDKILSTIKQ